MNRILVSISEDLANQSIQDFYWSTLSSPKKRQTLMFSTGISSGHFPKVSTSGSERNNPQKNWTVWAIAGRTVTNHQSDSKQKLEDKWINLKDEDQKSLEQRKASLSSNKGKNKTDFKNPDRVNQYLVKNIPESTDRYKLLKHMTNNYLSNADKSVIAENHFRTKTMPRFCLDLITPDKLTVKDMPNKSYINIKESDEVLYTLLMNIPKSKEKYNSILDYGLGVIIKIYVDFTKHGASENKDQVPAGDEGRKLGEENSNSVIANKATTENRH